jgi:hypothetical protein
MSAPTTDVSPNAPPSTAATVGGRRRRGLSTSWMAHVKATMRAHKGLKLKQVLKLAKKTYKKAKKGGGAVLTPALVGARRRRGTRRSRARRGGNEEMMEDTDE